MQYTAPYGMLPNGIYHIDEAFDSASFSSQHLFPGENAKQNFIEQLKNGVKLDEEHYLKRFLYGFLLEEMLQRIWLWEKQQQYAVIFLMIKN